ncbi:MAG: nucleotide exchange factor GrpE [Thermoleophilia bacterium]|nr:nucleotide exchange factor GrpE [Thermoleophilia bacterium]
MSADNTHSRKGPGGTTGARDGAGGLAEAAAAAAAGMPVEGVPTEPLPMEPGQEYVAKADFDVAVAQLTEERDAMRNDLQRVAADFENYKRRAAREREQASAAAESRLLGELLTVIDDTERALEHAAREDTAKEAVIDGLQTVRSRLTSVVGSHGLTRIDTSGTFDPKLHEAMMVQAAPNGEADDTILQELQSGWAIGERVLRHARVIVAGGG